MENVKKSTWVAGTVLLAVAILALSWFVLISPVVAKTARAAEDTQIAEDRNSTLAAQLARLEQQFAELGSYEEQLALIEREIPATGRTSDFLRTVDSIAAASGAAVVDASVGVPEAVAPAAVEAAPSSGDATEEGASGEGATDADGSEEGAGASTSGPSAAAPIPGFVAVPVTITALGNPVDVLSFLGTLQEDSDRLFLVTSLDGTGQDEAEASGGRPATAKGDLELLISGYVYVLQDPTAAAGDATEQGESGAPPAAGDPSGAFSNA
ncbi:hypothetical protein [Cellulomonas pakistanensis]|uniref:Pilus assembly protein PilO n=1 Tax=Cellulomonas pakistanensis TaxID=992287 RepID=A0A919U2F8_9CELL|nr:hypothetical protein [Cellulomonas pakistanensis]GIG35111.1 hypothetical protein Cpa01nite_04920 [Cellulomonas pakistanensis]